MMKSQTINNLEDSNQLLEEEPKIGIFQLELASGATSLQTLDTRINFGDTISWNPDYPGIVNVAKQQKSSNNLS